MQTLKIKRIHPLAKLPEYAHTGDAGMDLFAVAKLTLAPGQSALVKTGLTIELPDGTEAQIRPRSGLALNHQLTVLNSPGTIDHGYRGEVGVILMNHGTKSFEIEPGMKIAQMVIAPVMNVNIEEADLTESRRGEGGFGSTGV